MNIKELNILARRWQRPLDKIVQFEVKIALGIKPICKEIFHAVVNASSLKIAAQLLDGLKINPRMISQEHQKELSKAFLIAILTAGKRCSMQKEAMVISNKRRLSRIRKKRFFAEGDEDPTTYTEALEWFQQKEVLTKADFDRLIAELQSNGLDYSEALRQAHQRAFVVSRATTEMLIESIQDKITQALVEGLTLSDFMESQAEWIASEGFTDSSRAYLETVFRTNIQTVYNAENYRQMTDPAVLRQTKFWVYQAIEDERTCELCSEYDEMVRPPDDPIWDLVYPPNHFNDRCCVSMVADIPANEGIEETDIPKDEDGNPIRPDDGFEGAPDMGLEAA